MSYFRSRRWASRPSYSHPPIHKQLREVPRCTLAGCGQTIKQEKWEGVPEKASGSENGADLARKCPALPSSLREVGRAPLFPPVRSTEEARCPQPPPPPSSRRFPQPFGGSRPGSGSFSRRPPPRPADSGPRRTPVTFPREAAPRSRRPGLPGRGPPVPPPPRGEARAAGGGREGAGPQGPARSPTPGEGAGGGTHLAVKGLHGLHVAAEAGAGRLLSADGGRAGARLALCVRAALRSRRASSPWRVAQGAGAEGRGPRSFPSPPGGARSPRPRFPPGGADVPSPVGLRWAAPGGDGGTRRSGCGAGTNMADTRGLLAAQLREEPRAAQAATAPPAGQRPRRRSSAERGTPLSVSQLGSAPSATAGPGRESGTEGAWSRSAARLECL